jgi:uncharacterized protein (TIGR02099 family)
MIVTILKKSLSILIVAALLILLALAIYVSAGRQLLPYVADYRNDIEARLSVALGRNLQMNSVEARLNRFNPVLTLEQVLIFSGTVDEPGPALAIESLGVELDVLGSLLRWEWTVANIEVLGTEFSLLEEENGTWRLATLTSNAGSVFDADEVLSLISRFQNLTLNNMSLNVQRFDGREGRFDRARVRLQNRGDQHFLHLEAWQENVIGPLTVAAEFSGNRVAQLSGTLYLLLPESDYSDMVAGTYLDNFFLGRFAGSGEAWINIEDATVASVQGSLALDFLQFSPSGSVRRADIVDVSARFRLERDSTSDQWDGRVSDFGFQWEAHNWRSSNFTASYQPGKVIDIDADYLNVTIAAGLGTFLQVLGERTDAELDQLNPRGNLQNVQLHIDLETESNPLQLALETNLESVAISERKGAPAMWGINGYATFNFDGESQIASGMVEVESSEFMIQLPGMFATPWAYDRVNGRVKYRADMSNGQHIRLASSVIVAESEIITGRAQFATNFRNTQDEERYSELELIVGVLEGDLAQKSQYLPTGPSVGANTREVMGWLDSAVRQGKAVNSGLIYRGSVLAGAAPLSRTLQMFYQVEDGTLRFDEQWPSLENLHGSVLISDRNVDVSVDSGQSLDINFDATAATIRPNVNAGGSMLTVTGRGQGATQQGLNYLQATPVTRGFGRYLADWETSGNIALNLALSIPLGMPGTKPNVSVALDLHDSAIHMPEFELDFTALNGALSYDTASGLVAEDIQAKFFGETVSVALTSTQPVGLATSTQVEINGKVSTQALEAWPLQSAFVKDVLDHTDGNMSYMARFSIEQDVSIDSVATAPRISLDIATDLEGVGLRYPKPFQKVAAESMPLQLTVDFLSDRQNLRARLSNLASLNIALAGGGISSGLVFLGAQEEGLSVRRFNAKAPGLDVLGSLPTFNLGDWVQALNNPQNRAGASKSNNFSNLRDVINLVDVNIDEIEAFGQRAESLNVQIHDEADAWAIALSSEVVEGEVRLPYASGLGLDVALQHLRLPAREDTLGLSEEEIVVQEELDPLGEFDPRTLPKMHFSAEKISRGDADFGSWQFDLNPVSDGAEFQNLVVSARGLQAGTEGDEAHFVWQIVGGVHHSYLSAGLAAGDLAPVLSAFGYAPSLNSANAMFDVNLDWPGSPAKFAVTNLSGDIDLRITEGRFLQGGAGAANGALKLISIINFDALVRRLRFSDDLLRRGLAYEQIYGSMTIDDGTVRILDRLQIIGPASLFQVAGSLDLKQQTIDGSLYITLPVSDNIPWLSGIAALNNLINWQVAVGVFLFDQVFGDQVDSLTSAQYTLKGPWEGLQPELNQVFGTPSESPSANVVPVPESVTAPTEIN